MKLDSTKPDGLLRNRARAITAGKQPSRPCFAEPGYRAWIDSHDTLDWQITPANVPDSAGWDLKWGSPVEVQILDNIAS
jgi:hypothetical protein